MAGSRLVYDFTHNASARFRPPYWVKGEDSSFGFFVHISPFQTVRRLGPPRAHAQAAGARPTPPPPHPAPPSTPAAGDALGHLGHKGRRSLAAHGPPRLTLPLLPLQVTPIHWGWEVVT